MIQDLILFCSTIGASALKVFDGFYPGLEVKKAVSGSRFIHVPVGYELLAFLLNKSHALRTTSNGAKQIFRIVDSLEELLCNIRLTLEAEARAVEFPLNFSDSLFKLFT